MFTGASRPPQGFVLAPEPAGGQLTLWLLCPPPDIATPGEGGRADDFGSHPGVGPGRAHLGGAVPLAGQAKVGDLQRLVAQVVHLHPLEDEDWSGGGGGFIFFWGGSEVRKKLRRRPEIKRFHVMVMGVGMMGGAAAGGEDIKPADTGWADERGRRG